MIAFIKKYLHWLGSAFAVVGIIFVTFRLNEYSSQIDFSYFDGFIWSVLISLAFIYGLANIILAMAWKSLLEYFGTTASRLWVVKIYGLTQLAKYIPGNIMHLASRQAMGQAAGIPAKPLVKASIWETGLISIAGMFFSILIIPQFFSTVTMPIATVGFVSILLIVLVGTKRYIDLAVMRSFGLYIIFLVISGMVFLGVLTLIVDKSTIDTSHGLLFCGAFVVAWLIGLITPGAPAGVGVRELVLAVLLKGLVSESDLLLAIMLSRLITVTGDVLYFLVATILLHKVQNLKCNTKLFTE